MFHKLDLHDGLTDERMAIKHCYLYNYFEPSLLCVRVKSMANTDSNGLG